MDEWTGRCGRDCGTCGALWTALNGVPITPDMLRCHS